MLSAPLSAVADAQPEAAEGGTDPATLATARELAVTGVKLAREGRCGEAIDSLERAQALHHSAIVAEQLGSCYRSQGRLVAAAEVFRALLREPLPADATAALQHAYQQADAQLQEIKPLIASLVVTVDGPEPAALTLRIDGDALPPALLGQPRLTDPGVHELRAEAPGYRAVTQRVELALGQRRKVHLSLAALPATVVAPAPPRERAKTSAPVGPSAPLAPANDAGPGRQRIAARTLWVAGAVLLAAGGTFAFLALDEKKGLDRKCPNAVCTLESRDELDQARSYGRLSTVGLATGGAALAVGTLLYFTGRKQERAARKLAAISIRGGLVGARF